MDDFCRCINRIRIEPQSLVNLVTHLRYTSVIQATKRCFKYRMDRQKTQSWRQREGHGKNYYVLCCTEHKEKDNHISLGLTAWTGNYNSDKICIILNKIKYTCQESYQVYYDLRQTKHFFSLFWVAILWGPFLSRIRHTASQLWELILRGGEGGDSHWLKQFTTQNSWSQESNHILWTENCPNTDKLLSSQKLRQLFVLVPKRTDWSYIVAKLWAPIKQNQLNPEVSKRVFTHKCASKYTFVIGSTNAQKSSRVSDTEKQLLLLQTEVWQLLLLLTMI